MKKTILAIGAAAIIGMGSVAATPTPAHAWVPVYFALIWVKTKTMPKVAVAPAPAAKKAARKKR